MRQLQNPDNRTPMQQMPPPVTKSVPSVTVAATPAPTAKTPTRTPPITVASVPPVVSQSKGNVKINISPVETTFSGYKVEVFTSSTPLGTDSEEMKNLSVILSEIGVDKLKNGQYSYMVGTFLNWSETERFLEKTQDLYGKARIVEYFNGKRITQ
jgi:hypothetical protein